MISGLFLYFVGNVFQSASPVNFNVISQNSRILHPFSQVTLGL